MTTADHNDLMSKQAEKYLDKISQQDEVIADLRYQLRQYQTATRAIGWLIDQAMKNPAIEP